MSRGLDREMTRNAWVSWRALQPHKGEYREQEFESFHAGARWGVERYIRKLREAIEEQHDE